MSEGEEKTKDLNVSIPESLHKKVKMVSAETGTSLIDIARRGLGLFLYFKENLGAGATVELARWKMTMQALKATETELRRTGFAEAQPAIFSQFRQVIKAVEDFANAQLPFPDDEEEQNK